jgi:Bacteriophage protein gp37
MAFRAGRLPVADLTGIEWCDSTFNPWMGCTKVSPGCDHCYAERDTRRFGRVQWGAGQPRVRTSAANWRKPVSWDAAIFCQCQNCGHRYASRGAADFCPACESPMPGRRVRRRVFCASLADWLDGDAPVAWLADLLDLIRTTPNIDWLLLSKRIGYWCQRMMAVLDPSLIADRKDLAEWLRDWLDGSPPANVWVGATVVDQAEVDRDVRRLLAVPTRVRFLSIEPMLGPIDLSRAFDANDLHEIVGGPRIDWVICGGESGPQARTMDAAWVRSLRDQCSEKGVPFLFKQWGEWAPAADGTEMVRVGRAAAGRLLDGKQHDGYPVLTKLINGVRLEGGSHPPRSSR